MSKATYEMYRHALREHRLPVLALDLDRMDRNAGFLTSEARGKPIRVATKSLRSPDILRYLLNRHSGLQGLMTYSAREAAFLAREGFKDILMGYPTVERRDLLDALVAIKSGADITFMVCDTLQADLLASLAQETGVVAKVCVDLDQATDFGLLYFGVRRSGVRSVSDAMRLVQHVAAFSSLRFRGFMGYDAQIAGVRDRVPGRALENIVISFLKRRSMSRLRQSRREILEAAREYGIEVPLFNGAGTGSVKVSRDDESLTELTAGSGFFASGLFDHYEDLRLEPALFFGLPVTRKRPGQWITCHGGGYVASGQAGSDRLPVPYLPQGLHLFKHEGAGEVQTPLSGDIAEIKIGDPVFFRHAKAGEVCEHFNEMVLISGGKVTGVAKTYRGLGEAFL